MPYIVTTTNGTALATVSDNTVNITTTSLALVGKNYTGYGAFLNENYIKLLENFSNSTAPSAPLTGQLWWDSTNVQLKVYTGSQWKQMGQAAASATAPSGPTTGDLWWDTTNLLLKVWSGSAWLSTGSGSSTTAGGSTTGAIADTIVDTISQSHSVVKFTIANQVIAIVSKDTTFTPNPAVTGFTTIQPGINMSSTGQYIGTATNALAVNNVSSTSLMRSDTNTSTTGTLGVTNDSGLTVGNTVIFTAAVSGSAFNLTNTTSNSDLNLYINKSGVSTKALGISGTSGTITINSANGPTAIQNGGTSGIGNIGASGQIFNTIFAKATTAQYADLAEKYLADEDYEVGTVVTVGGIKEVTACTAGDRAVGVVSDNPAYMMNSELEGGIYIALKGRVPVKILGAVNKGDRIVSATNGCGCADPQSGIDIFALALESNADVGIKLVECIIF